MADYDLIPETQDYTLTPDPYASVPPKLLDRLEMGRLYEQRLGVAMRAWEGFKHGVRPGETLGFGHDTVATKFMQDIGLFHRPGEANLITPLRFATEAAINLPAMGLDAVARLFSGLSHGLGGAVAEMAERPPLEVSMVTNVMAMLAGKDAPENASQGEARRMERDIAKMADLAMLIGGTAPPLMRVKRGGPAGKAAEDEQIGRGLPTRADVDAAAHVITDGDTPAHVAGKVEKLYLEHGMTPGEVAADAAQNPAVKERLVAMGDRLPVEYDQGVPAGGGGSGGKPPVDPGTRARPGSEPPPKPNASEIVIEDVEGARAHIRSRLNMGEDGKGYSFNQFQTDWVNKTHALDMESGAVKSFSGVDGKKDMLRKAIDSFTGRAVDDAMLEAADNAGALARLYSGVAGKVQVFLESNKGKGGPRNFHTYEKVGQSLEDILLPVKKDFQEFREFVTAARSAEMEKRGFATGVNQEAARVVVEADKARFGKVMLELVDFQNNVAAYLRDSGVLNKEAYAAMIEANQLYVPMHRVFRVEGRIQPGTGGSLQAQNPIKALKGSEREIIDPLETIIKNTYTMVAMAEKNAVTTALVDKMIAVDKAVPLKRKPGTDVALRSGDAVSKTGSEIKVARTVHGEVDPAISEWLRSEGIKDPNLTLASLIDDVTRATNEDTIRVFRDGRAYEYHVSPELARAIKNLDQADIGMLERILTPLASTLRTGAIVNPVFWMRHLVRDPLAARTNFQRGNYGYSDAVKGLVGAILKDDDFINWKMSGGAHTSIVSLDRNFLSNSTKELADQVGFMTRVRNVIADPDLGFLSKSGQVGKEIAGLPVEWAKYTLDRGQALTEIVMSSVHLGAYKKVMRQNERALMETRRAEGATDITLPGSGVGPATPRTIPIEGQFTEVPIKATPEKRAMLDAAYISRETSVDNARIGANMRGVNMAFAFANARVQDMARLTESFANRPGTTTAMITGGVVVPSILFFFANHRQDETGTYKLDSRVEALPRWERDVFWVIATDRWEPASPQSAAIRPKDQVRYGSDGQAYVNNGAVLRLPKPYGIGVLFGSGTERALEAYLTENPDAWRGFAKNVRESFLGEIVVPTAMTPLIEQMSNRRLYNGAPVIPASMEKGLPEYQYTPYTTETAKALGRVMSQFPLIQSHRLDDSDYTGRLAEALSSPMLIEHYIRGWGGTLGDMALRTVDVGLRKAGVVHDPANPVAKTTLESIPFISAFVARQPKAGAEQVEQFFEQSERAKKLMVSWQDRAKRGDLEAAQRIQNEDPAFMVNRLDGIGKAIRTVGTVVRGINEDPKMPGEQKRQLIDDAYYSMILMAREGLKAAREAQKSMAPR